MSATAIPTPLGYVVSRSSIPQVRDATEEKKSFFRLRSSREALLTFDLYRREAERTTASNEDDLYILLLHGFQGNKENLSHHASRLVSSLKGIVAVSMDLPSLLEGGTLREIWIERNVRSAQLRCVQQVVAMVESLKLRSFVLVGHSAGGAVALEAAVDLQKRGHPPKAVVLLDGVPWPDTIERIKELYLGTTSVFSMSAEPSVWNRENLIRSALTNLRRASGGLFSERLIDVKVPGAAHGDPIRENSWLLRSIGLIGSGKERFNALLDAYVRSILSPSPEAFRGVLNDQRESGAIELST